MIDKPRGEKLVQTSNHHTGHTSLFWAKSRKQLYIRSALLLTVLLCTATFAAVEAARSQGQGKSVLQLGTSSSVNPQNNMQQSAGLTSPTQTIGTSGTSSTNSSSSTTVVINGKSATVPANGSYHHITTSGSENTSVDIDRTSSSSGRGQNSSSVNISVNSESGNDGN